MPNLPDPREALEIAAGFLDATFRVRTGLGGGDMQYICSAPSVVRLTNDSATACSCGPSLRSLCSR